MKSYTVEIKTEGAAFEGEYERSEVADILREAARRIDGGETSGYLRDVNGNAVGRFSAEPDDERPAGTMAVPV